MKKKLILCVLCIMVFLTACSNNETPNNVKNVSTNSSISDKSTSENTSAESIPSQLGGVKADDFNISDVVANYERLLIYAINNNEFSALEAVLIPNSKLYNSQKKLVQDLHDKNIEEKLIEFNIEEIQKIENEGIYKVFVNEKIGIKYSDKQVFETKEFNWIYTVEESNEKLGLSDIEKWNKNTNKELGKMDNNEKKNTMTDPFLFGEKDIYINNKPVLNSTYAQLIKDFGISKEINKFKVNPLATGDDYFMYFKVLVYDGLECEFSLGEEDREVENKDNVFRFDITNENFQLDCGLKVGMTTDEILSKYGKRGIYNINSTDDSELIEPILKSYKPDGYYSEYSQAMIIYSDQDKFNEPLAKALILLIENNKLDRIVFCYPTAD
jgi:hypothetical protein